MHASGCAAPAGPSRVGTAPGGRGGLWAFRTWGCNRWCHSGGSAKNSPEVAALRRTLRKRTTDILDCFHHSDASNGPTDAIKDRLAHLRDSALGFRTLTNYIARSWREPGGFGPRLHPGV
ncbi:transposase [uncultured Citricoccus sp.]|uniref:transposase n=1 Tax=uncultured Citricoccus sp. TaxID=614031 RepID=UPI0021046553|nr:transposase [Micrococcus sp. TA1]